MGEQGAGVGGGGAKEKRYERSGFRTVGGFGGPERKAPPRAEMRDQNVDQRRRDQQELGLERRIAHYVRRIGAEQQKSHADRKQKTEARQSQQQLRHRLAGNRAPPSEQPQIEREDRSAQHTAADDVHALD